MRIWIAKHSEVPIREQLTGQIILGIVSGDLPAGKRLFSIRDIARRFGVHSNTVSAAYRDLAERGWVQFRKGSGVFVREFAPQTELGSDLELDQLIGLFLNTARTKGFALADIKSRLKHWIEMQPPDRFVVIEPDLELRAILIEEIAAATNMTVVGVGPGELTDPDTLNGAMPVALYDETESVRKRLGPDTTCLWLRLRSVPAALLGSERPGPDAIICVTSRCTEFLKWAKTMLSAAGLEPDALSFRDARQPGWKRAVQSASIVIADAVTGRAVTSARDLRVFRLISDASLAELNAFVEQFMRR